MLFLDIVNVKGKTGEKINVHNFTFIVKTMYVIVNKEKLYFSFFLKSYIFWCRKENL